MVKNICAAIALAGAALASPALHAQDVYPSRPITMIAPFPPGGVADIVGRPLAAAMEKSLHQPVIVLNRSGAGGAVGTTAAAKAAPDGYTILISLSSISIFPVSDPMNGKPLPYQLSDFAPIALVTSDPTVLVVAGDSPYKTVQDFVAAAKANPGKINYASTGNGTALHVAGELFKSAAGIDVQHIPYGGGAQAMTALLAGEISYIIGNTQLVRPMITSGKIKGLAVTGEQRLAALPDLPTFTQAGTPGVDVVTWFGLFAPTGTPADIVEKLNAAATAALKDETVQRSLMTMGDESVGSSVADFTAFVRSEHQRWVQLTRSAGIKVD